MAELTIVTNNVPRDVIEAHELTDKERKDFDYINWAKVALGLESASFFRYRGEVYDLGEFERWDNSHNNGWWDGYQSDSFFSGILVHYVDDYERVIVGRYYT